MNARLKPPAASTAEPHRKALIKLLNQASHRHHLWEVFGDFIEMAALALANSCDLTQRASREERYMRLIGRYEPAEQKLFPMMFGELTLAMEYGPDDVLGSAMDDEQALEPATPEAEPPCPPAPKANEEQLSLF